MTPQFEEWKDNEYGYCFSLVARQGDPRIGHDPKTIATYLRLQAVDAFRDGHYEISARLSTAATALNSDARHSHIPRWDDALLALTPRNGG